MNNHPYLDRPLRTVEQAYHDTGRRRFTAHVTRHHSARKDEAWDWQGYVYDWALDRYKMNFLYTTRARARAAVRVLQLTLEKAAAWRGSDHDEVATEISAE